MTDCTQEACRLKPVIMLTDKGLPCFGRWNFGLTGEDRDRAARNRDYAAQRMTADQIAEAQRRAREWQPTPGP